MDIASRYGITEVELEFIMTKDIDEMTENEKDIWRSETLRRVNETTDDTWKLLKSSAETRRITEESMKDTKKLEQKWKEYQDKFDLSMRTLVDRISQSISDGDLHKDLEYLKEESKYSPVKMTAVKAGKLLKDKKNIIILTGAGLSAASGIPTFRGNDGLWTKKYKYCDTPQDLATLKFF